MTIKDLFKLCWKDYWDSRQFKISKYSKDVLGNYNRYIEPSFGDYPITKLSHREIMLWHEKLEDRPFSANNALGVLSKMYSLAIELSLFEGLNPCGRVKPFREKARSRYATEDEIFKIGEILKRELPQYKEAVTFIYAILLSGSRPRALERAKWSDVRLLPNGFATLEFSGKTGEETVIIPPQLLLLFKSLKHNTSNKIFSIKAPRKLWDKIKVEAKCPDLWMRDLRRTFATVGLSEGLSIDSIGELLNHKSPETTKIYAKLMETKKIESVSVIMDKINRLLGGEK